MAPNRKNEHALCLNDRLGGCGAARRKWGSSAQRVRLEHLDRLHGRLTDLLSPQHGWPRGGAGVAGRKRGEVVFS
jgi:hypothetical protein